MAEDRRKIFDAKTRKIAQTRPTPGKEGAAYQSAEKQLLAIQAEQQRNLEMARLSARSDAQQTNTLMQAAQVAAESANDGASEAVAQPVNPATQAMLSKYGMGQPRFIKKQSSSQQITRGNVVINNNTTNQTTNNVAVPPNIGGPLQGRPIQFGPNAAANSGGKFKLWLSQTLANQKEEAAKRDREWERRDSSLAKSANKMMRKLEEIGRTMSEKLDPRQIGTTISSQLKSLLFIFGATFLATNWKTVLSTVDKIEHGIRDFGHWLGFGPQESSGDTGLVKTLKGLFANNPEDPRSLQDIIFQIFYTKPNQTGPNGEKGILNILMDYFNDLLDDRKKALDRVLGMPMDFGGATGALSKLGLDKAFEGLGSKLGDILTAIVSGTKGLNSILGKSLESEATKSFTNEGDSHLDFYRAKQDYFSQSSTDTNAFSGDRAISKGKPFSFDFDSNGKLVSASAAMRQGNAILEALKDPNKTRTNEIITGFKKVEDYLADIKDNTEGKSKYIIWSPEKLKAIQENFGIDPEDPEWKALLSNAKEHGSFKFIKRKLTAAEKNYLKTGLSNYETSLLGKYNYTYYSQNKELEGRDYIFEMVPLDDKRAGIKDQNGRLLFQSKAAYGLNYDSFQKLKGIIQKYSGYVGKYGGNALSFNPGDLASIEAIENTLATNKDKLYRNKVQDEYQNSWLGRNVFTAQQNENRANYWTLSRYNGPERTSEDSIYEMQQNEKLAQNMDYTNTRALNQFANSNMMNTASGMAKGIDSFTNFTANQIKKKFGVDLEFMKTDFNSSVGEFKASLIPQVGSDNQWQSPSNPGSGVIALVGDSYVAGMSPFFPKAVRSKGGIGKCESGYYKVGAHINECLPYATNALNDGASVIIFHVGINDASSSSSANKNALMNLINKTRSVGKGQAKLYFAAPVYGQSKNNGQLGRQVAEYNTVLKSTCSAMNVGVIPLDQTSYRYKTWDREGIHPTGKNAYKIMAEDLVNLYAENAISLAPADLSNPEMPNGKVGSASGGKADAIAYAMQYFIDRGFSPEQAAGLVGNFIHESDGLNTTIKNKVTGRAFGIAQWLGDRKTKLLKKYGPNPTLKQELDFVMEELQTTHKRGLNKIGSSGSTTEAATNAFGYYEFSGGPEAAIAAMNANRKGNMEGNKSLESRIASANDALSIYNKRKDNIVDMGGLVGDPGGSYTRGSYSNINSGFESSGSSTGGSSGLFSSLLGNNSWLGALMDTISEMITHIWDYITPAITDTISENSDESDYEAYKLNPGELREGMTFEEWKAEKEKTNKMTPDELKAYTENQEPGDYTVNAEGVGKTADWMEAVITGNTNLIGKKPAEQTVELLAEIKELLEGHGKELKTGNEFAKIGIQATAQGFDQLSGLQLDNNQIVASNNSRKTPTSHPNDSGVNSQSIENFSAT